MSLTLLFKQLKPQVKMPSYAHPGDVGLDVFSLEEKTLMPGERHVFALGFALQFPIGFAGIMMDKGSTAKAGIHTMAGVFDAGYRGEYNVLLVNLGSEPHTFLPGEKLAQLVIYPVEIAKIQQVDTLEESSRGEGRFGSTGRT
jgi:dUTP pyrophosphatase